MNIRECDLPNIKCIGIYCITNLVNGKKYIGKTGRKNGFIERWNHHKWELNNKTKNNIYLQNAWNKYGEDNFEFSILEIIQPIDNIETLNLVLNNLEQYWIKYYDINNSDKGYNLTKGGEGILGVKAWNKGLTKETNEKMKIISEKLIGKFVSKETKQKQSISAKKRIIRCGNPSKIPEVNKKRSNSLKKFHKEHSGFNSGKNNGMYNVHRFGVDNPNAKSVILYNIQSKEKLKFNTQKECATYINKIENTKYNNSAIGSYCKGKLKNPLMNKYILKWREEHGK